MPFTGHVGLTGHFGHTGHIRRAGDSGAAGSIDAYSGDNESAMLVEALIQPISEKWVFDPSGRVSTVEALSAPEVRSAWTGVDGLPDMRDPATRQSHFWRMGAQPRAEICVAEALSRFSFEPDPDAEPQKFESADQISLKFDEKSVVTLQRPTFKVFKSQLEKVQLVSRFRQERVSEILTQLHPPEALWASLTGLNEARYPKTLELLGICLDITVPIVYRFKQAFLCPRPVEYSAQIQPIVMTPAHDSWPSGHSTEAHMTARLLTELKKSSIKDDDFSNMFEQRIFGNALRVAYNRQVAGLHFPADTAAGRVLGNSLGILFTMLLQGTGSFSPKKFISPEIYDDKGVGLVADEDSSIAFFNHKMFQAGEAGSDWSLSKQLVYMKYYWECAKKEWV